MRKLNSSAPEKNKTEDFAIATAAWKQAGQILGLFSHTPEDFEKQLFKIKNRNLGLDTSKIEQLITDRNLARQSKNWKEADRCRDDLTQMGVLIEDTPNGTEWKLK